MHGWVRRQVTKDRCKQLTSCYLIFNNVHPQWRHLIPSVKAWAARALCTTTCLIAIEFPVLDDRTTERNFNSNATWVIDELGLFLFDMFFMGFYKTRHWQTSGRPVQDSNIGTVCWISAFENIALVVINTSPNCFMYCFRKKATTKSFRSELVKLIQVAPPPPKKGFWFLLRP